MFSLFHLIVFPFYFWQSSNAKCVSVYLVNKNLWTISNSCFVFLNLVWLSHSGYRKFYTSANTDIRSTIRRATIKYWDIEQHRKGMLYVIWRTSERVVCIANTVHCLLVMLRVLNLHYIMHVYYNSSVSSVNFYDYLQNAANKGNSQTRRWDGLVVKYSAARSNDIH